MGTIEPVNAKDFIEQMNLNDSLVGMAKWTGNIFIYSEKSWTSPSAEIEIARVNIRPRKLNFFELVNSDKRQKNKDLFERYKKIIFFIKFNFLKKCEYLFNIDSNLSEIKFWILLFARSWMRRNSHVQFCSRDGIPK